MEGMTEDGKARGLDGLSGGRPLSTSVNMDCPLEVKVYVNDLETKELGYKYFAEGMETVSSSSVASDSPPAAAAPCSGNNLLADEPVAVAEGEPTLPPRLAGCMQAAPGFMPKMGPALLTLPLGIRPNNSSSSEEFSSLVDPVLDKFSMEVETTGVKWEKRRTCGVPLLGLLYFGIP